MRYDCLIIDDEQALAETTAEYFNIFGVKACFATSYEEGLNILKSDAIGVLLLDINLGSDSGFELCKEIRGFTEIPVLFISARQSDDDVLMALGIGGDDYIKKPYTLSVLLAKVKVVLKRYGEFQEKRDLKVGNLKIHEESTSVQVDSKAITLKAMEYKLLVYLVKNKNKLISKDELFEKVWGGGIVSDGTLNVHIRRLREKIEENPKDPQYIKTVWGIGYIFEDKNEG